MIFGNSEKESCSTWLRCSNKKTNLIYVYNEFSEKKQSDKLHGQRREILAISNCDSYDVCAKNRDKRVEGFDKRSRERNTG